jgi:hypothetical protein
MRLTLGLLGLGPIAALALFACGSDDPTAAVAADAGAGANDAASGGDTSTQPAHSVDAGVEAAVPAVSCNALCDTAAASCTGGLQQYASKAECLHECSDLTVGDYGDDKDTAGCRQAHAAAAAANPTAECPAAGPFGGGKCDDRCYSFCTIAVFRCGGAGAIYPSKQDCTNDCGVRYKFDSNAAELTDSGNTLNCRMSYLLKALAGADGGDGDDTSCLNAGPNSPACR